eukprot:Sspe_Gene.43667::Locus_21318_Transcript_1_2_Confidence_0.500_Length_1304::g.43667::m.43667
MAYTPPCRKGWNQRMGAKGGKGSSELSLNPAATPFTNGTNYGGDPQELFTSDADVVEAYLCPICHRVKLHPAKGMNCHHTFCHTCIITCQKQQEGEGQPATCPNCRKPLGEIRRDLDEGRVIGELLVRCRHDSCVWNGKRRELDDHLRRIHSAPSRSLPEPREPPGALQEDMLWYDELWQPDSTMTLRAKLAEQEDELRGLRYKVMEQEVQINNLQATVVACERRARNLESSLEEHRALHRQEIKELKDGMAEERGDLTTRMNSLTEQYQELVRDALKVLVAKDKEELKRQSQGNEPRTSSCGKGQSDGGKKGGKMREEKAGSPWNGLSPADAEWDFKAASNDDGW